MNEQKPEEKVNPIKYIKKGFWVWFGFLGAIISAMIGIFVLYLFFGWFISIYNYISTKPQRDWEECWKTENTAYHKKWDKLSDSNRLPKDMKDATLMFEKRQEVRKKLKLPSVICEEKGYKKFGHYTNSITGERKSG